MRVFTPDHIPLELVEQIKERRWEPEKFYEHLRVNCVMKGTKGLTLNPNCHLYVIVNEKKHVVGFLWFEMNPLSNVIYLQNFSMHSDYWHKGKAVSMLVDFMKKELKKSDCDAILWHTKYPRHSERNGFKKSKNVLMEYVEN